MGPTIDTAAFIPARTITNAARGIRIRETSDIFWFEFMGKRLPVAGWMVVSLAQDVALTFFLHLHELCQTVKIVSDSDVASPGSPLSEGNGSKSVPGLLLLKRIRPFLPSGRALNFE